MTMLKELSQYENLGTPGFFHELFTQLNSKAQTWNEYQVKEYFYNRIIDGQSVFDGCLSLAKAINAIRIGENGEIILNPELVTALVNERYLSNKILEMLLREIRDDEIFHEIFCSENMSYDIIYRFIQIELSAFPFKHSGFRKLLINFNFIYAHPDKNIRKLIVNSRFKKIFDRELLPEISRRKIGINELRTLIEAKQIHGEEGERFALNYEQARLKSHPIFSRIEIISYYDIGAGYDIISFNSLESLEHDRFIEVKSFVGVPNFHWSRNEIDVAKLKGDKYFLYLVNREEMNNFEYVPTIIQNPYDKILNTDDWVRSVDSYFIVKS